jgi:hypothetical protein
MSFTDDLGNIWTNAEDVARFGGPIEESVFFAPGFGPEGVGTKPIFPDDDRWGYRSDDLPTYPPAEPPTSDFVGTNFGSFLFGEEASMPVRGEEFLGGVDFPSLREIIIGAASEIPNLIESFQGGALSYTAQAPTAPLLGGACPPGRVLRRISLGRDRCIKKPHMNVCNRHALARSTRRVSGFLTMAKSTEKKMRQSFGGLLSTKKRSMRGGRCAGCGQQSKNCGC